MADNCPDCGAFFDGSSCSSCGYTAPGVTERTDRGDRASRSR